MLQVQEILHIIGGYIFKIVFVTVIATSLMSDFFLRLLVWNFFFSSEKSSFAPKAIWKLVIWGILRNSVGCVHSLRWDLVLPSSFFLLFKKTPPNLILSVIWNGLLSYNLILGGLGWWNSIYFVGAFLASSWALSDHLAFEGHGVRGRRKQWN